MLEKWIDSELFEGARAKCRPLDGPRMHEASMWLAEGRRDGELLYRILEWAVVDAENLPLLPKGDTRLEKFDRYMLRQVVPGIANEVVLRAIALSSLTEDERKN